MNQLSELVNINSIEIDQTKPKTERIKTYLSDIKNPYIFMVGDTVVRIKYSQTEDSICDKLQNLINK